MKIRCPVCFTELKIGQQSGYKEHYPCPDCGILVVADKRKKRNRSKWTKRLGMPANTA